MKYALQSRNIIEHIRPGSPFRHDLHVNHPGVAERLKPKARSLKPNSRLKVSSSLSASYFGCGTTRM